MRRPSTWRTRDDAGRRAEMGGDGGCRRLLDRSRCLGIDRQADCLGILQPSLDRGDNRTHFDRYKLDADERDAHESVYHHALVEDAVDDFGDARRRKALLDCHWGILLEMQRCCPAVAAGTKSL